MILAGCGNEKGTNELKTPSPGNTHFVWDFNESKKFIYTFSQTTISENKMSKDEPNDKAYLSAEGNLNVRIKENQLADLSLTNIILKSVDTDFEGNPRDTTTQEAPSTVIQDMKPDGSFDDSNSDILFDILFPLPATDLKQGEKDKIPMQMPFNANGSRLFAKGFNTLTFDGNETIEGRKCAVLKGEIDISDLEVPEELKGEYKCSTSGKATYYFDINNHFYVGADIQLFMEVLIDSESDDEDDFGMFMEIKSDNVYKIRLEKIEE